MRILSGVIILLLTSTVFCELDSSESSKPKILLKEKISYRSILKHHDKSYTSRDKIFDNPTLAYVTPWNSLGYDNAKTFNCKLDLVSPVWYNIHIGGGRATLAGRHDVDKQWIRDVRNTAKCSTPLTPKIVPRFRIDAPIDVLLSLNKISLESLVTMILDEIRDFDYDGILLDNGYINFRSKNREAIISFLKDLSSKLHENNKLFILVIPPSVSQNPAQNLFNNEDFSETKDWIDYYSLMTYDFSNPSRPGPSSPLFWSINTIISILGHSTQNKHAHKILVGVNFYGNDFNIIQGGGPILGQTYLELLQTKSPKIKWDATNKEHYFYYEIGNESHIVYYPTPLYLNARLEAYKNFGCGISVWEIGQGLEYFFDQL